MNWNDAPNYEEVHDLMRHRARVSAEVRSLELQVQITEAMISIEKPRNTAARVVGYDDETRERILKLRNDLATKRSELDELDAEVKFSDYHRDMYKAISYRERM